MMERAKRSAVTSASMFFLVIKKKKNLIIISWYSIKSFNKTLVPSAQPVQLANIDSSANPSNSSPDPNDLDKWTRYDVFEHFKEKAYVLGIPNNELPIFIEQRIMGKHLLEIDIQILKLAGFSIGS